MIDGLFYRVVKPETSAQMSETESQRQLRVFVVGTTRRARKVADPLKNDGVSVEFMQFTGSESLIPFSRRLKSYNPDVIITDSVGWVGAITFVLSLLYTVPYVVRVRGDAVAEHGLWLQEHASHGAALQFVKEFLKTACTLVSLAGTHYHLFVSEYLKDESLCRHFSTEDSDVVHTPVEFPENRVSSDDGKSRTILAVSNFVFQPKTRGLADAIEPIAAVLEDRQNWSFRIAGEGRHQGFVEEAVDAVDTNSIELLGYVDDIESEYRDADIFVHFSYLDAYPSTVLEAGAYGLPVVVNNIGGMTEQVNDGDNGYIVNLEDSGAVENRIEKLCDDPALRDILGEANRQSVVESNTEASIGERLCSYLKRVGR